jgi:hypothetical protein
LGLKRFELAVAHHPSGRGKQDAVKLLHQVDELFCVFFLNDGLSEVLPCFPKVANHSGCFFQDIRASDISSTAQTIRARLI